jgi:stage V sporulation protein SpoVS
VNDSQKLAVMSAVRSILIAVGGIAVARGYITDDVLTQVVGAFITIATAAWGVVDKLKGPQ